MSETHPPPANASRVYLEVDGKRIPLTGCTLPDITWAIKEIPAGSTTPGGETLVGEMCMGELVISFSPALMPQLPGWVDEIMHGKLQALDLQVIRTDPLGKVQERITLTGGILTELHFPECNANNNVPYLVSAVIKPETITSIASGEQGVVPVGNKSGHWLAASFAIVVNGLPTRFVKRVGSFSLKRQFASKRVGELRVPATYVGMGHCTPLRLMLDATDYPTWRDFALQKIAHGNSDKQRSAVLDLRDTTLTNSLGAFHFTLAGLTGFNFEPMGVGAASGSNLSAIASLAVSGLSLQIPR